jgi:hypothetical protein
LFPTSLNMSEIAALITRRGQLKAALTRFWTYVQAEARDIVQIETRKIKIEDTWYEFEKIQTTIEVSDDEVRVKN